MGLVLKCSTDPSAEWEGDSADGLQLPGSHDNQTREFLNGRCLFCPRHIQFARFCNCVFKSQPEEVDGVKEDKGLQWTEEAFPRPRPLDNQLSASPAATCSNPQGSSAYRGPLGGLTSRGGLEEKPSLRYLHFSLSHLHYRGITAQAHLIKWLIDFISKAGGGNGRPSPCD